MFKVTVYHADGSTHEFEHCYRVYIAQGQVLTVYCHSAMGNTFVQCLPMTDPNFKTFDIEAE